MINKKWLYWIETMRYIREVSGTIYADQLFEFLVAHTTGEIKKDTLFPKDESEVVYFLNKVTPFENNLCFLKVDPVTSGIYTVPSQRKHLDNIIKEFYPVYQYNEFLYKSCYDSQTDGITFSDLIDNTGVFNRVFSFDENSCLLDIDLTSLENPFFQNFDINEIAEYFKNKLESEEQKLRFSIGKIIACGIVFLGTTSFEFKADYRTIPLLKKGLCLSEATFVGPFRAKNLIFCFNSDNNLNEQYSYSKVDFRNTRFFSTASFRNIQFIGSSIDMELSFEDARLEHTIEFQNIEFGHTKLNFFQMIVGHYVDYISEIPITDSNKKNKIRFSNISLFEDSILNLSDVEIDNGEIILKNISSLPVSQICFSPIRVFDAEGKQLGTDLCPRNYLLIRNCEIKQTLYIGNVSELSFRDTYNYGKIVSAPNWGELIKDSSYSDKSNGFLGTKLGGTKIQNKLLLSVYNCRPENNKDNAENTLNCQKAKDFIMLKENFASEGLYDDEDTAFILYMEKKPFLLGKLKSKSSNDFKHREWKSQILYRILYDTGKYGISPFRVTLVLSFMVLFFSFVYFIISMFQGSDSFSIGSTLYGRWDLISDFTNSNITIVDLLVKILASFLYSLEAVVPFVSQFEPISTLVCVVTATENALGSFLVGYFSVAVVRKTLR